MNTSHYIQKEYKWKIMKIVFFLSIILISISSCKQYAKFETTIHKENATKDGIYLDDYVVNIDYDRILKLDGKKVVVRGRYTIVKGLDPNDTIIRQGRAADTKHILHPRIRIMRSK
ncbi:MAG: hypothetical protein COA38_08365 [Fluviicola sp.]|nr:MAG: hypothetical protein COA38_08365 [Fluviicola sp.]